MGRNKEGQSICLIHNYALTFLVVAAEAIILYVLSVTNKILVSLSWSKLGIVTTRPIIIVLNYVLYLYFVYICDLDFIEISNKIHINVHHLLVAS